MSNIKVDKKNDWFLILILVGLVIDLMIGLEGCSVGRTYTCKVVFSDGSYEYYELNRGPKR